MRKKQAAKYAVCECGTPPWPHRRGYCAKGAALAYMQRTAYGPPPEDGPGVVKSSPPPNPADVEDVFAFFDALASGQEPR
jgi:hypothetical protein